jgi:hypothetical protein
MISYFLQAEVMHINCQLFPRRFQCSLHDLETKQTKHVAQLQGEIARMFCTSINVKFIIYVESILSPSIVRITLSGDKCEWTFS